MILVINFSVLTAIGSKELKTERIKLPWDQVMSKWKAGDLHSGSKKGPAVKDQDQAVAIMLSEKRKAQGGKKEYQSKPASQKHKKAVDGLRKAHK